MLAALGSLALREAPARAGQAHVLRFSEGLDVTNLNPLLSTVASSQVLAQLTMAHFVRVDPRNRIVPELIDEIPTKANGGVSADGRRITYHLRHGVRWSDGAPFDAGDVVYTIGAIRNPANNVTVRDAWDHVRGVDEPDKYTVVIHLDAPYAAFYWRFFSTMTNSCVLPQHILGKSPTINEAPYNSLPVGIGPFRYTAFRRGDAIEMEANPYYFRGRPKLQKIVYKLITDENTLLAQLQTGELDLWGTVGGTMYDRVRSLPKTLTAIVPSQYIGGVYLNERRPVVQDPNVRRALRLATDRDFILEKINHGAGIRTESVVPTISSDYLPLPLVPHDPAGAARLLDASGWKRGPDGIRSKNGLRLSLQIALPNGYAPSQTTAELLRAGWQSIGIEVETKEYGDAQYFASASEGGTLTSGNFDAALLSLPGLYDADVSPYYACAYAPPRGLNLDRYCDAGVDADLRAYAGSFDGRKRSQLAREFQRRIESAAPTIVLYERSFIYAYASSVTGFHPGSFTAYDDFLNVDVGAL